MIADYLYNTPPLPTDAGALVLMTQQFASSDFMTSELVGKTLAQMRELPYVIGTADISATRFGFMAKRNLTSAYGGRTYIPNFSLATSAKFDVVRDGRARALVMVVLRDGACSRAVSLDLAHSGVDVTATRTTFSVDDDFESAIEGPLGVGFMVGKMTKALRDVCPDASPSVIAQSMTKSLRDVAPLSGPTVMPAPMITTLRDPTPPLTPTEFPPSMLRTLRDVAPTSS